MKDWAAVQSVYKRTGSKRETAKILHISRNTVKRLLEQAEEPAYHRKSVPTKIDDYKEQILIWRCAPFEFNGTRIFREMKKQGYEGSIGPIYRYLRYLDEADTNGISSKATVRIETPIGDQAQFDWSEYQVPIGDEYHTVYCFSLILAASRKKAVCFSYKSDAPAIYEAIQELFRDLGGVTRELLIDNPKSLVLENNPKSEEEIRYNPEALLMAKQLGTELNACPCYWPRKKGKIERPFAYIEEQFIKGRSFESMEDLNQTVKKDVNDWCNEVHTTTKRIPNEFYELEEKAALLPLPGKFYDPYEWKTRTISPDSLVSIEGSKYSVPVKYATKKVRYRIVYGFRIEIQEMKKPVPILTVEKATEKHSTVVNSKHYDAIAKKVSTSIPQIRRDFTKTFQNGKAYLDAAEKILEQPVRHARKILELTDLYEASTLDSFLNVAIQRNQLDIKSFRALLKESSHEMRPTEKNSTDPKGQGSTPGASEYDAKGLERDISYYSDLTGEASDARVG